MTNWSVFIKCAVLFFILVVFSILSGIYLPKDVYLPKESFTSEPVGISNVQQPPKFEPPVQTPLMSLIFSVTPMWTVLQPLSKKIDEYNKPIREETQWINKRQFVTQKADEAIKQITSELVELRPSIQRARANLTNTVKQVNELRKQNQQTRNDLQREPNILKQGELRKQLAERTPRLKTAVEQERQERQLLQPLIEQRNQLHAKRESIQPELSTSIASRAEMKRHVELLESYKTAQALLITEYTNQEKVLAPAYRCLYMLTTAQHLVDMIAAMSNLTVDQYAELAGRKPTVLSNIAQNLKDIDKVVMMVANLPAMNLVLSKDDSNPDSVLLNQLFLARMKELGLRVDTEKPVTATSNATNQLVPISLAKIQQLGYQSAMFLTKDTMIIQTHLGREITESTLRGLVNQVILPEKLVAFFEQISMIQQSMRQILNNPLADKLHHVPIQSTSSNSSIIAKSKSQPFMIN